MSDSLGDFSSTLGRLELLQDDENEVRSVQSPMKVEANQALIKDIICGDKYSMYEVDVRQVYELRTLNEYDYSSPEYRDVVKDFRRTMDTSVKVREIKGTRNYFLLAQYELKKAHKRSLHGHVTELTLFHGTKACNVESICENNLAWRKMDDNGYRFSKSVEEFLSHPVPDMPPTTLEITTIRRGSCFVNVLEVSRCDGDSDLEVPPEPDDVSASPDGDVVVKYFDNEFYPEYIIRYGY
ncbi:hypothetical protein JTB14_030372 [Gonioctena quinquepunctata]|nr:hypothetical protein JTB14_030372 [Gonioctena quinquepunctata]